MINYAQRCLIEFIEIFVSKIRNYSYTETNSKSIWTQICVFYFEYCTRRIGYVSLGRHLISPNKRAQSNGIAYDGYVSQKHNPTAQNCDKTNGNWTEIDKKIDPN